MEAFFSFLFFSFTCNPQGAIPTAQIVSIIGRAAQPIHVHSCLSRTLIVVIGVGVGMGEQGSNVALFIIHFHSGFEKNQGGFKNRGRGGFWIKQGKMGFFLMFGGLQNLIVMYIVPIPTHLVVGGVVMCLFLPPLGSYLYILYIHTYIYIFIYICRFGG